MDLCGLYRVLQSEVDGCDVPAGGGAAAAAFLDPIFGGVSDGSGLSGAASSVVELFLQSYSVFSLKRKLLAMGCRGQIPLRIMTAAVFLEHNS